MMQRDIQMAPSILSADFMNLGENVRFIAEQGADWIHVDVMDGHFVPNLTIGPLFVKGLKVLVSTPLDVHLMIDNPEEQVDWYLAAGADVVTIHIEASKNPAELLKHIRDNGCLCGLSLNPETPPEVLFPFLGCVDLILVMSVHPGFGGQSFIAESCAKIAVIAAECSRLDVHPLIEVDGGIDVMTAPLVAAAGARVLVAGSAIFGKNDQAAAMEAIRHAGQSALA
jgi:ribulose-phosphate 3-epimerase